MSYFDDASLVMIPSGYKTSKVYSVKPLDGSGDLTFTRSNDTATRVNSAGLIEKVRTNLFQFSEQLSNAYWGKTASGTGLAPVITDNFAPAPDGSNTAERAYFNAVGTSSTDRSGLIRQLAFTTGQTYTISVYAKSATGANQILQFRLCGTQVGSEKTVTNVWQRFTETFTATTSVTDDFGIQIRGNNSVNTSDLILWGFQLELSDVMTDYIPTTTAAVSVGPVANVPRLDYLGSSCPRLLLEPQTTALNQFSEQIDNAYWIKVRGTVVANTTETLDPSGYYGADKLIQQSGLTTAPNFNRPSLGAAGNHTASVFVKKGTFTFVALSFDGVTYFDLENGTIGATAAGHTPKIENYGNGWYRCSVTKNLAAAVTFAPYPCSTNGNLTTPDTEGYAYFWGVNVTATGYVQSYVPTLGAAVTRGADAASLNPATLLGATTGSWYSEIDDITFETLVTSVPTNFIGDDSANLLGYEARGATNKLIHFVKEESNVVTTLYSFTPTGKHKACFVWSGTSLKLFVDGVKRYDAGSFVQPTAWDQFQYNFSGREAQQYLNQTLLFPTALSDADAISLTTL